MSETQPEADEITPLTIPALVSQLYDLRLVIARIVGCAEFLQNPSLSLRAGEAAGIVTTLHSQAKELQRLQLAASRASAYDTGRVKYACAKERADGEVL